MPYVETTPIYDAVVKELREKQTDMEKKADERLKQETSGETDSWTEDADD